MIFINPMLIPFFNITANVEVTKLVNFCKAKRHSFFLLSLHTAMAAVNNIPELKYRLVGEELRVYDTIHPGSTILKPDKTFTFCYFDFLDEWQSFEEMGKQKIDKTLTSDNFDPANDRQDLVYCSSIPWISFTQFKHARPAKAHGSIPKLTFGKYFEQNQKWWMPLSVEVHHALADGYHLGLLFKEIEDRCRIF